MKARYKRLSIFTIIVIDGWTDRETDKFFDTIHGGMQIFVSVKCGTSLLALLAGGALAFTVYNLLNFDARTF